MFVPYFSAEWRRETYMRPVICDGIKRVVTIILFSLADQTRAGLNRLVKGGKWHGVQQNDSPSGKYVHQTRSGHGSDLTLSHPLSLHAELIFSFAEENVPRREGEKWL